MSFENVDAEARKGDEAQAAMFASTVGVAYPCAPAIALKITDWLQKGGLAVTGPQESPQEP